MPIRPTLYVLTLVAVLAPASAQHRAAPGAAVSGLVQSASGRSLAGAAITFVPDPPSGVEWLDAHLDPPVPRSGQSDARGRFRIPVHSGTGCLWVEHPGGLGIARERYSTGAPERLRAEPLGAIRLRGAAGRFSALIQLIRRDGSRVAIGERAGVEVALPAGVYLLLIDRAGARTIRRARVTSGRITELERPPARPAPWIRLPERGSCAVDAWPHVPIPAGAEGIAALPHAAGYGIARCSEHRDGWAWIDEAWYGPAAEEVSWPLAVPTGPTVALRVRDADGSAPPDARFFVIERRDARSRVRAEGRAAADGSAQVNVPDARPGSELALVVCAAAGPPVLADWPLDPPADLAIQLPAWRTATLRVLAPSGDTVGFARVRLRTARTPEQTFVTDRAGRIELRVPVDERAELHIDDDALLPFLGTLPEHRDDSKHTITLEHGLELSGVAYVGPDDVAADVRVDLRDPTATTGIDVRYAVTDSRGRFTFRGLPEGIYALFAQFDRDGVTWSGQLGHVQPGDTEWRIDLRNEDPALPRRR